MIGWPEPAAESTVLPPSQRVSVDLSNTTIYLVEFLFSFKGITRVEVSEIRICPT